VPAGSARCPLTVSIDQSPGFLLAADAERLLIGFLIAGARPHGSTQLAPLLRRIAGMDVLPEHQLGRIEVALPLVHNVRRRAIVEVEVGRVEAGKGTIAGAASGRPPYAADLPAANQPNAIDLVRNLPPNEATPLRRVHL